MRRRRYMTVLAAIYGFEIPRKLFQLDPGAKKLFDLMIFTMRSRDARTAALEVRLNDPFVAGCKHWEYLPMCNPDDHSTKTRLQREALYTSTYEPIEQFVVQTLLQQHRGIVFPLWPTFEKRLQANHRRHVHRLYFSDEYRAVVTAVAIRKGIDIPQPYFLYTPLTDVLVGMSFERAGLPSDFVEVIKLEKVEPS